MDNGWFVRVILVLWLISTVFVVFLLGRVDWIVHHELYNYGLQFSFEWASEYWGALRMIYVFLAVPVFLSVAYFGLEIWRFAKVGGARALRAEAPRPIAPLRTRKKERIAEQNYMLISCPKCKRVFSKPLVMLDFSTGKSRFLNVCPYCNFVLGWGEAEKDHVGLLDLEKRKEVKY